MEKICYAKKGKILFVLHKWPVLCSFINSPQHPRILREINMSAYIKFCESIGVKENRHLHNLLIALMLKKLSHIQSCPNGRSEQLMCIIRWPALVIMFLHIFQSFIAVKVPITLPALSHKPVSLSSSLVVFLCLFSLLPFLLLQDIPASRFSSYDRKRLPVFLRFC